MNCTKCKGTGLIAKRNKQKKKEVKPCTCSQGYIQKRLMNNLVEDLKKAKIICKSK